MPAFKTLMSKHSKCTDTYEKINEADLFRHAYFYSIFYLFLSE